MCKATVQIGPRKGERCLFPETSNGYCDRHQRNYIYDTKTQEGKHLCRFFFRGCNTEISETDHAKGVASCVECRAKLQKKQHACEHEGCIFKVGEPGFCKKHERDAYRREEVEKGIRYCDIARGCFTVCADVKASCDACLEKARATDTKRYALRKQLANVLETTVSSSKSLCVTCGKDFDSFNTRYKKASKNCKSCSDVQKKQDVKRTDRVRNYKEEHAKNLEQYYKVYITKSSTREIGLFELDYETFCTLVTSPCHYCKYVNSEKVNGIDRMDNDKGYIPENCVSACAECNYMKSFYHPSFFINKCKQICKDIPLSNEFIKIWDIYYNRSIPRYYSAYKQQADTRGIQFNLSETQYYNLSLSPCYLCGFKSEKGVGLDRVVNTDREYSIHTVKPCCGTCNAMKRDTPLEEFLNRCKRISDAWPTTEALMSIPVPENPLKKHYEKGHDKDTPPDVRTHWRATGLYYTLLSKETAAFEMAHSAVLKPGELATLSNTVLSSSKEAAIPLLKTFLQTLRKRRARLAAATKRAESEEITAISSL